MKQTDLVLSHIHRHGYITPLVAANYGVTRLASRIYDLAKAGHRFAKERMTDDRGRRYVRYRIAA